MAIKNIIETNTTIDAEGNETTTTIAKTTNIERNNEPDYIKLYTKMWCEYNGIPEQWRELFLQLVVRMSYASSLDKTGGQIVSVIGVTVSEINSYFHWKTRTQLTHGLKALCDCNAIKRIGRGQYQINPQYAGRGEWKYNPRLERGGVEDLVAKFNFRDKTVETQIVWADDGSDSEINKIYRQGMKVNTSNQTILKTQRIVNN